MKVAIACISLAFAIVACSVQVNPPPDYASTGALAIAEKLDVDAQVATGPIAVDLYWPDVAGSFPAVVAGHGFAGDKSQLASWGRHLASWGFVVVAPRFPGGLQPDHDLNGRLMKELGAWAASENARAASPLFGRVDPAHALFLGHSAGGLAAALAAAETTNAISVLLDPVDAADRARTALTHSHGPMAFLFAEGSLCNDNAAGSTLPTMVPIETTMLALRVSGANHCEPIVPPDVLCTLTCGESTVEHQRLFRAYGTAFFLRYARGDRDALTLPAGVAIDADVAAGRIDSVETRHLD